MRGKATGTNLSVTQLFLLGETELWQEWPMSQTKEELTDSELC